ncbi:hypothetical protein DMW20_11900 [Vibrio parahaemolyticus]|nr:hypothetical protein [Vibrio parahaemolyticus]
MIKFIKKAGGVILIGIAMVFGSGIAKVASNFVADAMASTKTESSRYKLPTSKLPVLASEMNKGLPMMIDSVTRLDAVVASTAIRKVGYMYTVLADATADDVNELAPSVITSACTSPKTKGLIMDGIPLEYSYFKESGEFIGEFTASMETCSKTK